MKVHIQYNDGEYSIRWYPDRPRGPESYEARGDWEPLSVNVPDHVVEHYSVLVNAWNTMQTLLRQYDREQPA